MLIAACGMLAFAGCSRTSYLDARYIPDRAEFGDTPIPASSVPPAGRSPASPTTPAAQTMDDVTTGTWTFVTPPTVTRVEHKTDNYSQFSLYYGRPEPTDTPFLVITVSNDARGIAESDPDTYRIINQREYALNGNTAHEWTGNTKTGAGFCELLIHKPPGSAGSGEVCHAMAIARTQEERTLALDILASIAWKPMLVAH
jgi:hypothetical protein